MPPMGTLDAKEETGRARVHFLKVTHWLSHPPSKEEPVRDRRSPKLLLQLQSPHMEA